MKTRKYQDDIAVKAANELLAFGTCYLSMECRTGKTITALSAADTFDAQRVLFITKLKAMPSIKADYEALKPVSFHLDVINYESAHKAKGDYDLIIIDEAHSLGAYPKPSKRTQEIKKICEGLPVLFLSGTPSPESYSQLYHQFWV
ncbi:MAG: DEAD/DEAH box helicase family protein, partial [Bacteroides sp.]